MQFLIHTTFSVKIVIDLFLGFKLSHFWRENYLYLKSDANFQLILARKLLLLALKIRCNFDKLLLQNSVFLAWKIVNKKALAIRCNFSSTDFGAKFVTFFLSFLSYFVVKIIFRHDCCSFHHLLDENQIRMALNNFLQSGSSIWNDIWLRIFRRIIGPTNQKTGICLCLVQFCFCFILAEPTT